MLRVGVIGVGAMGRNHARVYSEMEQAELVAVADANADSARRVAAQYRAQAFSDYREMLAREKLDAISIVVPTRMHLQVAQAAAHARVAMLVEKPVAASVAEAEMLITAARRANVFLMIGHIERFNPAIIELKNRLDKGELGKIFELRARRLGPFPARVRDVGVVLDLATHDLDIMCHLVREPITRIYAETARRIHTEHEDLLLGTLSFANGAVGLLDINWLTPTKVRELSVTGERGMFVVNYLTQELCFYRNDYVAGDWNSLQTLSGVGEGEMVKPYIQSREPLKVELETFLRCVESKTASPVTGEDSLNALVLAQKMIESGETHRVAEMNG